MKTEATVHGEFVPMEQAAINPSYQAYQILRWGFVAAPLLAGVDKFFHFLVDWDKYLWAPVANAFGGGHVFMSIVGAIEIIAAFLVAFKPKFGGLVVAVWLWGIIINLLLVGNYFDIALRDFGLSLGALALARLAVIFDRPHVAKPS